MSGEGSLDAPGSSNELDATDGEASNESYTLAETTESSEEEPSYNKADFYEEDDESAVMMSSDSQRAASISPMYLSDEMKYFAKYESSCNYDQGFSWGDGYHALGYYQFDHRYGLRDFLLACYAYDSATYSMFGQFASVSSADFRDENAIRKNGEFTDLGNKLNAAWHAAYAANPSEFAALQDGWAYVNYYLPAEDYLASRGIDISNRADCVKGLCWGMSNLFGTGGWRKFVGGWTNGYDWNGVWQSSYNWPGCGLNNSMTDREFVTTLCNYVVDNVAVFYKAQPQYHAGWQNRYRNELKDCLSMLKEDGWVRAGSEWKYAEEGVYVTNDWRSIGGAWYWFGSSGNAARSTFAQVDGLWYYFDDSCAMVTGWVSDAGHWYYMNGSGVMQSGWASIEVTGTSSTRA
ncbi:MAG: N-acetylmuramoyl-L-alanine amidase family protein [Eggerthellaceae bacterium]